MKGISDYMEFIFVHSKNSPEGKDMVVSTHEPYIAGVVHRFSFTEEGEAMRLKFLEGIKDPYHFAKAHGVRFYICLWGGLNPLPNSVGEDKEMVRDTLLKMIEFYSSRCVREGCRREYGDNAYRKLKKK